MTAVAPGSAPNDLDAPIVITGTGFTAGVTVTLDTTELVYVGWVSTTTLTATVPWGLEPGVYILTVFEPGGGSGSLPNAFTVTEGFGVWNNEEMYGGRINQVVVHPLTPTVVYALANEIGLFRSPDSGATWSTIVPAPPVYASLAIDPLSPHWLYLSPAWRSEDGGDTWVQMDVPPNAGPITIPTP